MLRHFLTFCLVLPALVAQETSVSGRVLGPEGKPVPGALVAAIPASGAWRDAASMLTDPAGRFRLPVKAGSYGLTATLPGLRDAFLAKVAPKVGQALTDLTLQMSAGGHRVSGHLVDGKGRPVKAAQVAFLRVSQDEGDAFLAHMKGNRFEATLGPGSYLVEVKGPGDLAQQKPERLEVAGDVVDREVKVGRFSTPAGPKVKAWIKGHGVALTTPEAGHGSKDMEPLRAMVGKAQVVSLGEATHGTREFFQMKHRMLEFLVTKMGFTVFAIEANMPEARAVDAYVLEGKGDPAKALAGLYFWTWNTEEVLEMIRWMRRYNEDPKHVRKVRFYGFDMQTPMVAFREVKAYLAEVDPEGAALMDAQLPELGKPATVPPSAARGRELVKAVQGVLDRLDAGREAFVAARGEEAFAWARQDARVLQQNAESLAEPRNFAIRDRSMAENTRWILDHEKGAKAVLWAHNGHVSTEPEGSIAGARSMGFHLRQALGGKMFVAGFAFRKGGFQAMDGGAGKRGLVSFEVAPQPKASLAEALASAGRPLMVLDLRRLPARGPVRDWFDSPQGFLDFGAMFNEEHPEAYVASQVVDREFDALIYVDTTTTARPNGGRRGRAPAPAATLNATPTNLGFEEGAPGTLPPGWFLADRLVEDGFRGEWTGEAVQEGKGAFHLFHSTGDSALGWATAMQSVDPTPYLGKRVRLSGWIRTDGKPENEATIWMRVDRPTGTGFFDNALDRPVTRTTWTRLILEGVVDADAKALNFGCMLKGTGHAWFDGLVLETVN
ncbi:MAG TPA: erythromycin esterase family protein [Holophagaceae bacterium]|nr:erythromycin esterase family protein [Holophagaceae bacterium]